MFLFILRLGSRLMCSSFTFFVHVFNPCFHACWCTFFILHAFSCAANAIKCPYCVQKNDLSIYINTVLRCTIKNCCKAVHVHLCVLHILRQKAKEGKGALSQPYMDENSANSARQAEFRSTYVQIVQKLIYRFKEEVNTEGFYFPFFSPAKLKHNGLICNAY